MTNPRLPHEGEQRVVPIDQLRGGKFNPRKDFKEAELLELADSIRQHGLVQPIIVRADPAGGYATGGTGRIVTEIPGSTLPRAVVFRDSFTSSLAPLISEHFSRVVYLWQNDFDAAVVESEHPDVVLHEIVGRHLHKIYPYPDLIP